MNGLRQAQLSDSLPSYLQRVDLADADASALRLASYQPLGVLFRPQGRSLIPD
jgi:hypothetical protein